ncbi:TIGR03086 family metal-binding protein [Pseudonocardia nigra]|uniref:TIGR03086 family metal-binding protein n=1 Tax=Pseudonocardia nigra TaxID=1921578 RepID=UPI001C5E48F0|nr:TIGR03086 family metal-binding protein [Pseudonocardia nigra]
MTTIDHYRRAQDGFDRIVATLPADRWDDPSACSEWSNRDVLGHVVWGQHLVRHLATGVPYASGAGAPGAPNPGQLIPSDPVGTWRAARAASVATLTPDALARVVRMRAFGEIPLEGFVIALVTDFLAHAWDIGAPAGLEVRLDPDLVPGCFAWARTNDLRVPGGVGPEVTPPPGADEQTRFLAFLGRDAAMAVSR